MSFEHCDLLHELSSNIPYQCIIASKFVLCVIGAYGVSHQWSKQGVRFLIHNNTKTVFKFYYAMNLTSAITFALFYLLELIRLRFDCYIVNFRTVLLSKGIAVCAFNSAHYLLAIFSSERLYSSIFPEHFEKNSSKLLASVMSLTVIMLSFYITLLTLSNGFTLFGEFPVALFEERISQNKKTVEEAEIIAVITNGILMFIFISDFYLNFIRKPSNVNPSLSLTYQIGKSTGALNILPIEVIESSIVLITMAAYNIRDQVIDDSQPMKRILYMEMFTFPMLFPIILSIVIELRVARRVQPAVTTTNHQAEHFESLRRAWDV